LPQLTPLLAAQVPEGPRWEQRPVGQWSVAEAGAWLAARSGAGELAELAHEHAVSGRALLRLTEGTLRRMGVAPRSRRRELLRELLRLRLQQELEELLSIVGGERRWGWGFGAGTGCDDARGWWSPSPLSPE
ncbi:protein aveugle-like, partial [Nyctibius grandis]|uniref:protein aveugle-like n=1 Tax=Nyctibius grandis TaxID=48427 RepID=UPI0035BC40B4